LDESRSTPPTAVSWTSSRFSGNALLARLVHAVNGEVLMENSNSDKPVPNGIMKIMKVAVALIVVGIVLWLVNTYVPMAGSIRAILNIVVVVSTCVLVLQAVGLWSAVVRLWTDLSHRISG
jgi:predicted membrane protein